MRIVAASTISLAPDRQMQEFTPESIGTLSDDIANHGLYHAPLVRETPGGLVLVAGERRLRAIHVLENLGIGYTYDGVYIEPGFVPAVTLGDATILHATEAELNENILREPLTWEERVMAESRLVELHAMKAQVAGTPTPPLVAIARELDAVTGRGDLMASKTAADISDSLQIAKHLDDPEVRKAGSKKEAKKIVERKRQEAYNIEMAKVINAQAPRSRHTLIKGDVFDELKNLPSNTFDGIICDPPYGRDLHKGGEQGNASWRNFDDSYETWYDLMTGLAREAGRILQKDAHVYVFCSVENFDDLYQLFRENNFNVWPRPIIWAKGNVGALPFPDFGPRYTYECILFARKGEKKDRRVATDVILLAPPQKTLHPDEKPVSIYLDLLNRSAIPGEKWLDPFAGSGTIFAAANQLSLTATAIEKNETYYSIAMNRIDKET